MQTTQCIICASPLSFESRGITCSRSCRAVLRERRKAIQRADSPLTERPCSVEGCDRPHYARGWCNMHYQRVMRSGTTDSSRTAMPEQRRAALHRWRSMVRRCTNPATDGYHRYGGRGIYVCDEWLDFETYYSDVGDPPEPGMSLDRIDNDGPYAPWNVRWATPVQQRANQIVQPRPSHCPHGHPYDAVNTYVYSDGRWACRKCRSRKGDAYLAGQLDDHTPPDDHPSLFTEATGA